MGSSYRQDLNSGRITDWQDTLIQVVKLLTELKSDIYDAASNNDQIDNAIDDGGLYEKVCIAKSLLASELPKDRVL